MGDSIISSTFAVLTAIVGLAIIAVLVSRNAQTGNVLTAGGNAFAGILKTAVSPVTGAGGTTVGTIQNLTNNLLGAIG